MIETVHPVSSQ